MTNEQFIKTVSEQYHNLKMETLPDIHQMHTDTMKVITAFIGKNPASTMYGKIIGFFTYKGLTFRFHFHVHKPHQRYAWLSNKMTDLEKLNLFMQYGEEFIKYEETSVGNMAFWEHTSLDYLKKQDENSYELRKLMMNITDYSRTHDFCKYFRKMDRTALKMNHIYKQA